MEKLEDTSLNLTFEKTSKKSLTYQEVLETPELAHFHDVVRFLQTSPRHKIFPEKFEMSMKRLVVRTADTLFDETPTLPLNKVIASIMDKLPDDVPPPLLLKMTQIAIEKWESLTHDLELEQKRELVAA